MKGLLSTSLAVTLALAAAGPAAAGDHVRVVLDVSGSMKKNDPGRLAILSTLLLYDLAAPNPTLDDSFEILPFDRDWRWEDPSDPPPRSRRERIRARFEARAELLEALDGLDYEAEMTYFYPGIAAAVEDLRQTPGGAYDVRAIVLVTDGVPEPPTRETEARLIREDLVPLLEQHGIRLYVLAFSEEARRYRDFLDAVVRGRDGRKLGEVFLDPDGADLLSHMLHLFARSFGYTPDAARGLPGVGALDLKGASKAERVAVVVHSKRPEPPRLALTPPPGGALNAPDGVASARQSGASYSLIWSLSPDAGDYAFATDAVQGSVAVLRPTRLRLEVLPSPPRTVTDVSMAETAFPLRVLVRPPLGVEGDPGPVELAFRPLGERIRDPVTGKETHTWEGDRGAPPAGQGSVTPEGRIYEIAPRFEANRRAKGKVYVGYLEVEARRGEAVVGALRQHGAHRVEVHPLVALAPLPLTAYASDRALEARERSCTRFTLTVGAGELPHPDRPEYALRAVVATPDEAVRERELRDAFFTLDGVALDVERQAPAEPGAWYKGRTLSREKLLGEHEVCVRLGKPTRGDPALPLELPIRISLLESPYDDFGVVRPFTLKVLIAPPGLIDRWGALFTLSSVLAALAALLWYLRDRPELPHDLRYALGRRGSEKDIRPLGAGAQLRRYLGLVAERPLVAEGEETTLGWLRPADDVLYRLRPASGVRIRDDGGKAVDLERGLATLAVHRPYRLESDRGTYRLLLGYE